MKKTSFIALFAFLSFLFAFTFKQSGIWSLDKNHAKLGFTITHLMVSDVDGIFSKFDARIISSKADFSDAIFEVTADAASINTDNDRRDTHLRSADFFDVAKYPLITFRSNTFSPAGPQKFTITGNLTIHGITKPVVLSANLRQSVNPATKATVIGLKVTGTIKRSDFKIGNYPTAVLSDEVQINANGEFGKN